MVKANLHEHKVKNSTAMFKHARIRLMILPVVAIVLRLRISQPKGASGKARSLVKLLQFSLGASSI
jgi:hypothetical protein